MMGQKRIERNASGLGTQEELMLMESESNATTALGEEQQRLALQNEEEDAHLGLHGLKKEFGLFLEEDGRFGVQNGRRRNSYNYLQALQQQQSQYLNQSSWGVLDADQQQNLHNGDHSDVGYDMLPLVTRRYSAASTGSTTTTITSGANGKRRRKGSYLYGTSGSLLGNDFEPTNGGGSTNVFSSNHHNNINNPTASMWPFSANQNSSTGHGNMSYVDYGYDFNLGMSDLDNDYHEPNNKVEQQQQQHELVMNHRAIPPPPPPPPLPPLGFSRIPSSHSINLPQTESPSNLEAPENEEEIAANKLSATVTSPSTTQPPKTANKRKRDHKNNKCWDVMQNAKLLELVSLYLTNSVRGKRFWKSASDKWNKANPDYELSNDDLKMKVKQLLKERKRRGHNKFWKDIRSFKTFEEVRAQVGANFPDHWPLDTLAKFFLERSLTHSNSGRARMPSACSPLEWDSQEARDAVIAKLLALHATHGMKFSLIHTEICNLFSFFDVELTILANCKCAKCSLWNVNTVEGLGEQTLALTRAKSKLLYQILQTWDAQGQTSAQIKANMQNEVTALRELETLKASKLFPQVEDWDVQEFQEFLMPVITDKPNQPAPRRKAMRKKKKAAARKTSSSSTETSASSTECNPSESMATNMEPVPLTQLHQYHYDDGNSIMFQ